MRDPKVKKLSHPLLLLGLGFLLPMCASRSGEDNSSDAGSPAGGLAGHGGATVAGAGGGGGSAGTVPRFRVIDVVPDHALRAGEDPSSIVRRTLPVASTRDAAVVVGRSEIFVLADGSTTSTTSQGEEAFRWTEATGTVGLGFLPGAPSEPREASSRPTLMNGDGSIVVGQSVGGGGLGWFRWTAASGMVALGALTGTETVGINASSRDGAVLVGFTSTDLDIEAARWTEGQGFVHLGKLPGHTRSDAEFVSDDGSIAFGNSSSATAYEAVRWTVSGIASLGRLPGLDNCRIFGEGVTPDGSVAVGACGATGSNPSQSFLWSEPTGMISLGQIAGHTGNNASRVSSNGATVIGTSTVLGNLIAFGWTKNTGMVPLLLPGHVRSFPHAVSADGSTVVLTSSDSANVTKAVRWTAASGLVEQVPLAGDDGAHLYTVNADGSIVAGWSSKGAANESRAVYWDAQSRPHSIAAELAAAGIDLQGYQLSTAFLSADSGTKVFHDAALGPPGLREWVAWLP